MEMFNPVITQKSGSYETEEGCLSLTGQRKTRRFQYIKVRWQDRDMVSHVKRFSGWTAQIIQHELDHLDGILYIDHMTAVERLEVAPKLKKLAKANGGAR